MKNKLALYGGEKVINKPFETYNSIGEEEISAVEEVLKSGTLSKFLGEWHPDFYGGSRVNEFENDCKSFFNVKHAITVNSWTSGLTCCVGSIGIEPGDEVIVTPWTMCASASSILHWNAIPVFADIESKTYNLDPKSIEKNITKYTKAIMVADIFGHSANMKEIMKIAKNNNLKVISDTAQSPGAFYKGKYAGTLADVGGFSLNYHKHIHTGEGGIIVTNDDLIAENCRLIRNHAEAVVGPKSHKNLSNMLGYNYRLGEIESAIGIIQLKKLPDLIKKRQEVASRLSKGLSALNGLKLPFIEENCSHVYYVYALQVDEKITGVSRNKIHQALVAEGLNIGNSYSNLHLLPMYQRKIAYGSNGFPWSSDICKRDVDYSKGICPTSEMMDEKVLILGLCEANYSASEIQLTIDAFQKVWDNLETIV